MKNNNQREMRVMQEMPAPSMKFVDPRVVRGWKTKREAVLWCWLNRPCRGLKEPMDQAICAREIGMHAPHLSRCLNQKTKAPMDLRHDYVNGFERYTGWYGVSQFEMFERGLTIMEEVIAQRAA